MPASVEEIVQGIEECILSAASRGDKKTTQNHRKKLGFGELARAIADAWKGINPSFKDIFSHYAQVDLLRYKRELKFWKEKKDNEEDARTVAKHAAFMNRMSVSFSSLDGSSSAHHSNNQSSSSSNNISDESSMHNDCWNVCNSSESFSRVVNGSSNNRSGNSMMHDVRSFNNSFASLPIHGQFAKFGQEQVQRSQMLTIRQQILQLQELPSSSIVMTGRENMVNETQMCNNSVILRNNDWETSSSIDGNSSLSNLQADDLSQYNTTTFNCPPNYISDTSESNNLSAVSDFSDSMKFYDVDGNDSFTPLFKKRQL